MVTPTSILITGASAVVALSSGAPQPSGYTAGNSLRGKWVQILAPTGNGANVLIGGPEVTASVGFPLVPGQFQFLPPISELNEFYDLSKIKAYVPSGNTLEVLYGG